MEYYVYGYLKEDGSPYYIGKGKGNRYKQNHGYHRPPLDESRIKFFESNLSEEDAYNLEIHLIASYGRKDLGTGTLINRTDGGEGASSNTMIGNTNAAGNKGKPKSSSHKRKISEALKGKKKSEEQKSKQSAVMKGRTHPDDVKKKRAKSMTGLKWWHKGTEKTRSKDCPGPGWIQGRGKIYKRKDTTGYRWWNNGTDIVRSPECPGQGWVIGRSLSNNDVVL
jgi:hypothetical protein